jgi:cold shock CspA family protein
MSSSKDYGETSYHARVKWFSRKKGWGFLTIVEPGDFAGDDIFVQWRSLETVTQDSVYKYLVGGEYIDATMQLSSDGQRWEAAAVTGIDRGPLMCEYVDKKAQEHGGQSQSQAEA